MPNPAASMPCERCACYHEIIPFEDGTICAVCRCVPRRCHDMDLKKEDTILWSLNWPKFARALCAGFSLNSKFEWFDLANTAQIGSWSADGVPAILTLQSDKKVFRYVVAALVARLHCPFILFAPTSNHIDATSLGYLANV